MNYLEQNLENKFALELLSKWVDQHTDMLIAYAKIRVKDLDLAQDLVQETFLAAHKHLAFFRGESKPSTWLVSILRNKIIDHIRKESKRELFSINTIEDSDSMEFNRLGFWQKLLPKCEITPEDLLREKRFRTKLFQVLETLPENLRVVFILRVIDEHSVKETAEILSITSENVRVLLYRARMRLRRKLEGQIFTVKRVK